MPRFLPRLGLLGSLVLLPAAAGAQPAPAGVFTLGLVEVTATADSSASALPAQVGADALRTLDRRTLATALPLVPGVHLVQVGDRNEALVSVRGFDSRQVPLFLDGVPVYVPYDGNVDLRRFTTGDVALVSVAKGFSSVLYGPNALGGAINVVSRRPQAPLEGGLAGFAGSGDLRGFDARLGALRGSWYAQVYAGAEEQDTFPLSDDFRPVATENGGDRDNAGHRDRKASLKLGYAPGSGAEHAVGVSLQRGEKGNPPYAGADPLQRARFWRWPAWDKTDLYYVATLPLGDAYLKPRLYYDTFVNTLAAYDDATYSTQVRPSSFVSYYDDYTWGGSLEAGLPAFAGHTLKSALHFKRDVHREHNAGQPVVGMIDETASLGIEDTWRLPHGLSLVGGISLERRRSVQAQTLVGTAITDFPGNDNTSANPQLGLFYRPAPSAAWHLTVARKTRFPTLKDRYSYRMGQALPNPALRPEHAFHFEAGYTGAFARGIKVNASVFVSQLRDAIIQVNHVALSPTGVSLYQLQNASRVEHRGGEIALEQQAAPWLRWSASYAHLHRENKTAPLTRLTDTPQHRVLAQAEFGPWRRVSLVTAFDYSTDRHSTSYGIVAPGYAVTDLHLRASLPHGATLRAGVGNLFDRNYALREGYPQPGRTFFTRLDLEF